MLDKELNKLIGNALVQTGILVKIFTLRLFKKRGINITPEQFTLLNLLYESENLHQRQLGELLFKDKANIARLLSVLESDELIERIKTSDKRLVNKVKITEKGKKLRDEVFPTLKCSRSKYLANINREELEICLKVLTQIQDNLRDDVKIKS